MTQGIKTRFHYDGEDGSLRAKRRASSVEIGLGKESHPLVATSPRNWKGTPSPFAGLAEGTLAAVDCRYGQQKY